MATRRRNQITCPYCNSPNCSLTMSDFFPKKKVKHGSMMHNDKQKAIYSEEKLLDFMSKDNPLDCMEIVQQRLVSAIINSFENLLIEGLKRKGFEFEDRNELEKFIKSNCWCEDQTDVKRRVYFVNNVPFLLYFYAEDLNITFNNSERANKAYADIGKYTFL